MMRTTTRDGLGRMIMVASLAGLAIGLAGGLAACEGSGGRSGTGSGTTARSASSGALSPATERTAARVADKELLERFMKIRTPGAATLMEDGTLFVRDWPEGVFQVYRVPGGVAKPGAKMEPLTSFADGASGYSLSPDGKRLLIEASVGGNENDQIYTLDPKAPAGTELKPITNKPKVQYSTSLWLRDSSGFIFTGNDDSPNDFYIYKHDFGTGQTSKVFGQEGSWSAGDISDDGKKLLISRYFSISNSPIYELDVASGELKDLSVKPESGEGGSAGGPEGPTSSSRVVGYMPGEKQVLLTSDAKDGVRAIYLRDLESGKVSRPLPQFDGQEVEGAGMNDERTLLVVSINKDGFGEMHVFELPGFQPVTLPKIEEGVVGASSLRGRRLIWTLNNARTPGLAFVADIPERRGNGPIVVPQGKQITFTDDQGIDLKAFPLPQLIRYDAFDGTKIPALVYTPVGYKKGAAIPFIVLYHGGPEGQHRPVFSATMQYFLTQGFGVMMPNVRGSTGFGRAFHMMDDYKKRWDSVRDGVDAAKWLVDNGYAKPGKIATMGGSYGGFMSVACLVEDQERVEKGEQKELLFGAGINNVGIVNMKTFLEQTSGYRRKLREVEYGPLSDPEFLASVSPLNKIDKIKVPMMISHGLNDPRVPVGEAMQLAVGLQRRGFDPEQVYFADEGHGAQKLENRLVYAEVAARFLEQHLK